MNGTQHQHTEAEHQTFVDAKRRKRMEAIDAMSAPLRACVHDYGFQVVDTLICLGVKKPNQIRHVVETILNEFSPTRGSFSIQGVRTELTQVERQP